ncbi:MAG: hypothetical protein FJ386_07685 [Verrucomicrobia bacterium]|nr:hypothetical protein [Verrucomicrobiota bacterium]
MTEDSPSRPSFSLSRRFGAGFNVLLGIVVMVAIIVMVNFLSARHFRRHALSGERKYVLATSTQHVLRSLTNQVKVTIYFDPEDPLYSHVSGLLKEYSLRNPRIVLDSVNYAIEPGKAELVKATYKLPPSSKDLVIFDAGGKTKIVRASDLSNYDMSDVVSGKGREVRRKSFNGEQHFTSALITLGDRTPLRAAFSVGHGEHDPGDGVNDTGYGRLLTLLNENNVEAVRMILGGTNDIPTDINLVIVAGPKLPFEPVELEKLHRYLGQGGRLLVLHHYAANTGLEALLERWGVQSLDRHVTDRMTLRSDASILIGNYSSHDIVRPLSLAALPLQLAMPRVVERLKDYPTISDAPQIHTLFSTTEGGEAIVDYRNGLRRDPLRDRRGVIPLAVAVEKLGVKGESRASGSTRLVVAGDSFFLDNQMITSAANRDFAWNAVNWLLDRSNMLGIAPQSIREFKFNLSDDALARVRWIVLGAMPGAVLFWGWLVFIRRRH